jgi:hypothetical protein
MDTIGGLVGRIGFIAVLVFFVSANLSFIFYQFAKHQSKKEPNSLFINQKFLFRLFVSSLMGMLFFLMVTIFVYSYLKMPIFHEKGKESLNILRKR